MNTTIHYFETGDDAPLHPLFHQYEGQNTPQEAHIALRLDTGKIYAETDHNIGAGIEADVWHGTELQWTINRNMTATEINTLMDELQPLLDKIYSLMIVEWDGSNHKGRYIDHDAQAEGAELQEKIHAITEISETTSGGVWYAENWLENTTESQEDDDGFIVGWTIGEHTITKITTRHELQAIVQEIEREARHENTTVYKTYEHIEHLQDQTQR